MKNIVSILANEDIVIRTNAFTLIRISMEKNEKDKKYILKCPKFYDALIQGINDDELVVSKECI